MKRTAGGTDRTASKVVQLLAAPHGYKALYQGPDTSVKTAVVAWGLGDDGSVKPMVMGFSGDLVVADSVAGFYAICPPGVDDPDEDAWVQHVAEMEDDSPAIQLRLAGNVV